MVKLFIQIASAGIMLLAAELGGFDIQVEPGEQTETPSGWEDSLPEEDREDVSDFPDNTAVYEEPVPEENTPWTDSSRQEEKQWEESQWEESQWEESQWMGAGQQEESRGTAVQGQDITTAEPDRSEISPTKGDLSTEETPEPSEIPAAESGISPSLPAQEEVMQKSPESRNPYPRLVYWRGETAGASRLYLTMRQTEHTEIFSLRVNGTEAKWHREGMKIVIETCSREKKNLVELAVFSDYSWTEPGNSVILSFK